MFAFFIVTIQFTSLFESIWHLKVTLRHQVFPKHICSTLWLLFRLWRAISSQKVDVSEYFSSFYRTYIYIEFNIDLEWGVREVKRVHTGDFHVFRFFFSSSLVWISTTFYTKHTFEWAQGRKNSCWFQSRLTVFGAQEIRSSSEQFHSKNNARRTQWNIYYRWRRQTFRSFLGYFIRFTQRFPVNHQHHTRQSDHFNWILFTLFLCQSQKKEATYVFNALLKSWEKKYI